MPEQDNHALRAADRAVDRIPVVDAPAQCADEKFNVGRRQHSQRPLDDRGSEEPFHAAASGANSRSCVLANRA